MPKGKAIIHGGQILRPELGEFDLFPALVAVGRRDELPPSIDAISKAREQLRDQLELYLGKHYGADLVTATVRQTRKNRVRGSARRLARHPDDLDLRADLRKEISTLDLNGKSELNRALNAHDREVGQRRSYLWLGRYLYSKQPIAPDRILTLRAVAAFADAKTRASWKDPFLPDLVWAAAPIWKELSGRSAFHQSENTPLHRKRYPFAKWLDRIVDAASEGKIEVHEGTIVDVLRALKNRPVPGPTVS
jgi:hypothetical protein